MSRQQGIQRATVLGAALVALVVLQASAVAQPPQRGGEGERRMFFVLPVMAALDADADGVLSADEIAKASERLLSLDRNGNGQVDAEELRPAGPPGGRFARPGGDGTELVEQLMGFDKNDDGGLTADEVPQRMRVIVERADTDEDGVATREELLTAARAMAGEGRGREGERGGFRRGEGGDERGEGRPRDRRPPSDG